MKPYARPYANRTGKQQNRTRTELEETLTPTQQTVPRYVDRPENFDDWLIWLDQTCAAARRVGIESQVRRHRGQLAAWALRWVEEAACR